LPNVSVLDQPHAVTLQLLPTRHSKDSGLAHGWSFNALGYSPISQPRPAMEKRVVTSSVPTDMPQWAAVTVAIILCLAFALSVIIVVATVGRCCVCCQRPSASGHRATSTVLLSHSQMMADHGRPFPENPSVDSVMLAGLQPPPPVYIPPPGYYASFKAASTMEQGVGDGHSGL